MKSLIVSLMLLFPLAAVAAPGKEPIYDNVYALECPGEKQLITSFRADWLSEGESVPAQFRSFEVAVMFYQDRVSRRSLNFLAQHLPYAAERKEPFGSLIDWRTGIRIERKSLGLPAEVRGCKVVPIIVQTPEFDRTTKLYYGSQDDFRRLTPADQLIVILASQGVTPGQMRLMMADSFEARTPRQRLDMLKAEKWTGSFFRGFELYDCEKWSNQDLPAKCRAERLWNHKYGGYNELLEIQFEDGAIVRSIKGFGKYPVLDLNDEEGKITECGGTAIYFPNGRLRSCNDGLFLEDGRKIYGQAYAGQINHLMLNVEMIPTSRYDDFTAVLDERQKPMAAWGFTSKSQLRLQGEAGKYQAVNSWLQFYPNGQFKSGMVIDPTGKVAGPFLLVVSISGEVIRKEIPKKETLRNGVNLIRNLGKETATMDIFFNRHDFTARKKEFTILASEKNCPAPQIVNDQVTLGAGCSAVIYMFYGEKQ